MFRKLVTVLSAAVIFIMAVVPVSAETATREVEADVPPRLLVLGDSIATGYGLEGYDKGKEGCQSYANILKDRYSSELPAECEFTLTNRAVDGMTSEGLLSELNSGSLDEALKNADCIIISIGGNDLLHALWDFLADKGITSPSSATVVDVVKIVATLGKLKDKLDENLAAFETNLTAITGYITSKTEGVLIMQTLYDPFQSFGLIPGFSSIAADKIARLDETIRAHAGDASRNYTVCDVAPEFVGRSDELTNMGRIDIHPNAEGHKVIAELLDKTVRAVKYSYTETYEIEPAVTEAESSAPAAEPKQESSDSTNGWIWLVLGLAGGAAVVGIASVIVIKKRGK